jgi:hypothetical protein
VLREDAIAPQFNVKAFPNPSTTYFTLAINSSSGDDLLIQVTNIDGVIISNAKVPMTSIYRLNNNLLPGVYYVRVTQGRSSETLKIVKQ